MDEIARRQKTEAKEAKLQYERICVSVASIMSHPAGRDFFWWLLDQTGCRAETFTGNALTGSFNQGAASVGRRVEGLLAEAAPDFFLTMLKERQNARSNTGPEPDANAESDGD